MLLSAPLTMLPALAAFDDGNAALQSTRVQTRTVEALDDEDFFNLVRSSGDVAAVCGTVAEATAYSTAVNAFGEASAMAALSMCRGDIRDLPDPFEGVASAIAEVCP